MELNKIILLNNLLTEEIEKYKDLSLEELKTKLLIEKKPKNLNKVIFDRIIANSVHKNKILELLKYFNSVIKTINLEWNNSLKESVSLKAFKYSDIYDQEWLDSDLRTYFQTSVFVFVVFKKDKKDSRLEKIRIWKMPDFILDGGVKDVWLETKKLISEGRIVNFIDEQNRRITYFPKSGRTKYIHVRPHARNKDDEYALPIRDKMTGSDSFMKHSFWFNRNFVKLILIGNRYYE